MTEEAKAPRRFSWKEDRESVTETGNISHDLLDGDTQIGWVFSDSWSCCNPKHDGAGFFCGHVAESMEHAKELLLVHVGIDPLDVEPLHNPHTEFYIVSLYHSAGDNILWWRPKNAGYTVALEQAGRYTQADLDAHPGYYQSERNMAVPCGIAESLASRVVDSGHLVKLKETYGTAAEEP